MSMMVKQGVAKRVLEKHIEELEKERHTRDLFHQRDVSDIKRELKVQDADVKDVKGRKSVKNELPPVTLFNKERSSQLGRSVQNQQQNRLAVHRHSIDIADIARFKTDMNQESNAGDSVVNQMQSILNQTKARSTKTSDEIWMERFQERFPSAAAKAENALKHPDMIDGKQFVIIEKSKSPRSSRKPKNAAKGLSDVPTVSLDLLFAKDDRKKVSFDERNSPSGSNKDADEHTEFYRLGDDEGAWKSARKCRYLRGYDPPDMVLPEGENTQFVFGRNFNQALEDKRKHKENAQ
ncbi:hypothetical protein LOTGIDRAFT_230324 [Lottia gigantea]|uniref:Uncharacterized protein n=1 Tax=Lottia gigantea TaxID=225164 RepID=V4AFF2_LOTGI|nr:hypothetical protein LOTGIDRAFT_230324 [Lottia gigantea]ESP02764.1 hypothetical protein LOTGIDRAFT_230324 [Lottia gigantea]